MEVKSIVPRGYCFGVVNALNIVKKAVDENPDEKVHVLGIIIHNKFVKKALDNIGVITIDDPTKTRLELLDEVNEGVVVFSAHGISQQVIDAAKDKGLIVYDASCPDVNKTQSIVKDKLAEGYDVIYIGKENHPEAEAMLSIDDNIHFITHENDLIDLDISNKVFVTNQTTMSIYDIDHIIKEIQNRFSNVEVVNEICNATRMRQEALMDLDGLDLVYVVGDHRSNNSNNLKRIASRSVSKVYLIESVQDINPDDLVNIKKVGVTAGASTPTYLTNQVISYLEKYPNVTDEDLIIDYSQIL